VIGRFAPNPFSLRTEAGRSTAVASRIRQWRVVDQLPAYPPCFERREKIRGRKEDADEHQHIPCLCDQPPLPWDEKAPQGIEGRRPG
jgi:hypothetical protein